MSLETSMRMVAVIVGILCLLVYGLSSVSAGLFGPDPTPVPVKNDVWEAVDKCWVYNPGVWDSTDNYWEIRPGVVYFVTYRNQNGHYKIEQVDIDTWYNSAWEYYGSTMYYQGGR